MATTYTLIDKAILSSTQASVTFSSIPNTYTDLLLKFSVRLSSNGDTFGNTKISFNGTPTGSAYAMRNIRGNGSAVASNNFSSQDSLLNNYAVNGSTSTSSTFASCELYIPNYTSSNYKSVSVDNTTENNATEAWATLYAGLWSDTSVISSIVLTSNYNPSENYASGSSFYLYGIKNS